MPIIHLGDSRDLGKPNFQFVLHTDERRYTPPFGSGEPLLPYDERTPLAGPFVYATYESHHGLCLRDYECNGYDDSDWYMEVWNPEKHQPETILFASTRGWSYPCYGSSPDATYETKCAYQQWIEAEHYVAYLARFKATIEAKCNFRKFAKDYGKALGFPSYRFTALRKVLTADDLAKLINLIGNSRLRSAFKLKLREQVLSWLRNPAPQYKTPLSRKQMEYI